MKVAMKDEQSLKDARGSLPESISLLLGAVCPLLARSTLCLRRANCCSSSGATRSGGSPPTLPSHCARANRVPGASVGRLLRDRYCSITCCFGSTTVVGSGLCCISCLTPWLLFCRANAPYILSSWFGSDCQDRQPTQLPQWRVASNGSHHCLDQSLQSKAFLYPI